jgi:hypothetical protein
MALQESVMPFIPTVFICLLKHVLETVLSATSYASFLPSVTVITKKYRPVNTRQCAKISLYTGDAAVDGRPFSLFPKLILRTFPSE